MNQHAFLLALNCIGLSVLLPFEAFSRKISPERVCQYYASQMEKLYNIPDKLLTAVSLTESGKASVKGVTPWPWTINVEGKGYYFPTKSAAIQAVRKFQKKGIKSIDIGCMQINLLHHPQAFSSIEEAFEPEANIRYGANFLKNLKNSHKNWGKAVAHYHSATPSLHTPYKTKVLSTWLNEKRKKTLPFLEETEALQLASNKRSQLTTAQVPRNIHRRPPIPPPPRWARNHNIILQPSGDAPYRVIGGRIVKVAPTQQNSPPQSAETTTNHGFFQQPVRKVTSTQLRFQR